jgi:Predicted transcriptional regulators
MHLTVGSIAKEAGVNLQTIRYYEKRRLIPAPRRGSNGYRQYSPETVRRILFIKRAQELGFSLREIQELLNLRLASSNKCGEVKQKAEIKIKEIENKITSLRRVKSALVKLKAQCEEVDVKPSTSDCPLLEALEHFS